MQTDLLEEARRQSEICNACRYCEGYCSVFPALHSQRSFSDGNLMQIANLCHNCRGCYYACQYTSPHEFNLNLPQALANLRQESWEKYAYPSSAAKAFHRSGALIIILCVLGIAILYLGIANLETSIDSGFYSVIAHGAMVSIFLPAFVFPIISITVSLRRYWQAVGGQRITVMNLRNAFLAAAKMRNLSGGHGEGCNFEDEDRFSNARRFAHQAVMYGFLLCFASTTVATLMHYGFGLKAPYPLFSLPKLLGVPGGLLLTFGTIELIRLKIRADKQLGAMNVWGGEVGFTALLGFVGFSGLLLYFLGGSAIMPLLLAIHLGSVLAFFLLMPYTKMVHGFYRLAALIIDDQRQADIENVTSD